MRSGVNNIFIIFFLFSLLPQEEVLRREASHKRLNQLCIFLFFLFPLLPQRGGWDNQRPMRGRMVSQTFHKRLTLLHIFFNFYSYREGCETSQEKAFGTKTCFFFVCTPTEGGFKTRIVPFRLFGSKHAKPWARKLTSSCKKHKHNFSQTLHSGREKGFGILQRMPGHSTQTHTNVKKTFK